MQKIFQIIKCYYFILCVLCLRGAYGSTFNTDGAWIDIPASEFVTSHPPIKTLVDQYHHIPKTEIAFISERIKILEEIITAVDQSEDKKQKLLDFRLLSEKKKWYLQKIKTLQDQPENNVFSDLRITDVDIKEYKPIEIINKILFDFRLPTFWGLYHLEVIDPCHRMLTPFYKRWQETATNQPFFMWLETQEMSFRTLQMKFFTQDELKKLIIIIENGSFRDGSNTPSIINYMDQNKEYIYILDMDKRLIVTTGSETIRHSSLSLGKPVLGAGALKIKDGFLNYIDTESGHYQPSPEVLEQTLAILRSQGAVIDPNIYVMYYDKGHKCHQTVAAFEKKYGGTQPQLSRDNVTLPLFKKTSGD